MSIKKIRASLFYLFITLLPVCSVAETKQPAPASKLITISDDKVAMIIDCAGKAAVVSMIVNGRQVVSGPDGMFTSVRIDGVTYSSLRLISGGPSILQKPDSLKISGIKYGDSKLVINENWVFIKKGGAIKWKIERSCTKAVTVEEAAMPQINFDSINTWEGAYQGYGGLAWFYLFNEKLCTYGVHTRSSSFWNSKTGDGLHISVDAPGNQVAMKYTRTTDDKLAYTITTSQKEMLPRNDSDTHRRRFIRGGTLVWAPFAIAAGKTTQSITFNYFDYKEKYGRGQFAGLDGSEVSAVLGTIARIGVIDSLHFGGNSWHTPYGPICLHEQYIAQIGLGVNDPEYLNGYKSCLNFYRDHAILPDGRVYPRWAYTNEDAMPGRFNKDGFYEAQWGILMDSNPDFVTNVSELYDLTGDQQWVKGQQLACEKALDWILKRDSNHNGLVEMMTGLESQKKSSDWIDIIWASYENAFVNAKLYHALVKWSVIERLLNNNDKATYYEEFAAKLKASFNKPTTEGGFWDEENKCYVHWRDKDNTIHGRNMVTPVNFMAIAYSICDDAARRKLILDGIESKMEQEKLFFWPLCMTSYAKGEGNDWQWPFPAYENGDLFLSWGSVGVKAYADYDPAIAVKYVKNVLAQYGRDGLAFQRYGRLKQDGQGDDILSGNSLSIVGLYQAVYGINPLYNRFYLDPHITPELAGTELKYNYRGQPLTIKLDTNHYSVSTPLFTVMNSKAFGVYIGPNSLSYFNGDESTASLKLVSVVQVFIAIKKWSDTQMQWTQKAFTDVPKQEINYVFEKLKPNTDYVLYIDGKMIFKEKSHPDGKLAFGRYVSGIAQTLTIKAEN